MLEHRPFWKRFFKPVAVAALVGVVMGLLLLPVSLTSFAKEHGILWGLVNGACIGLVANLIIMRLNSKKR